MSLRTKIIAIINCVREKIKSFFKTLKKFIWNLKNIHYLAVIAGVVFGVLQYRHNSHDNIRENTIQYLVGFSELLGTIDPVWVDTLNFYGHRTDYDTLSVDALKKLLSSNVQYRRQINNVMYYLNQLAIGCEEGFFEERIVYIADRYDIIYVTNALTPYFTMRNEAEHINTKNGNTVCFYLRNMVDRWKTKEGECAKWRMEDSKRIGKLKEHLIDIQAISNKKKQGINK